MTKLPEKTLLAGSKTPNTTTGEMKDALGKMHDYLNELFGNDSTDKKAAQQALGIDLAALNARIDKKPDSLAVESLISDTIETVMARVDVIKNELKNEIAGNGVPAGTIACFAMPTPPAGYLKADGTTIRRADYPTLFAAIGTTFGEGDGSTTFSLPDCRGEFIRGWDDSRGTDTERSFGSLQEDAIRNITGSIINQGNGVLSIGNLGSEGALEVTTTYWNYGAGPNYGGNHITNMSFDASRSVPTANENRPRNIALLACIKY